MGYHWTIGTLARPFQDRGLLSSLSTFPVIRKPRAFYPAITFMLLAVPKAYGIPTTIRAAAGNCSY